MKKNLDFAHGTRLHGHERIYGERNDKESAATILRALDLGINPGHGGHVWHWR